MNSLTGCLAVAAALFLGATSVPAEELKTDFYAVSINPDQAAIASLSLDSLGQGEVSRNVAEAPKNTKKQEPVWIASTSGKNEFTLSARTATQQLTLTISQRKNHATLLGVMSQDGRILLPALLHLPDQGSLRISSRQQGTLGYEGVNGTVKIIFPPAEYHCEVVAIHPQVDGIETDPRFDGFRRDWLNILQISPHWRMLANHSASDTCAFCYYEYADIAQKTPPLADGFDALDLVKQTLIHIMNGANAYGMPGHGAFPEYSSDTLPSLLIAARDCVRDGRDDPWLATNYAHLKLWTDKMLAADRNSNGLVKYVLSGNSGSWPEKLIYRPANWWDTIGFGWEDAYANALAYRALRGMEELADQSKHHADQVRYRAAADRLRAAYFKEFFNPATGVLAGWRSDDGQLHDYYFPWISGIAIHYGLVPNKEANLIMDRLLAKMKEVGYTRFDLGLPGNLIPVARKDYVAHDHRWGGGTNADNSDGFQIYENGGATACFAYFTLAALYDLGRVDDADRILFPMLHSFAVGDFQGRGPNGLSKDWRTWDGTCWGYEGFLVDNYYTLLAVLDRETALKKQRRASNR